ncbi:DUF948 domain-containing protein [Aerococcus suis]|uniref:Uncharacterized protein YoxC, contains an MCP-like domain n=1 Tax=Aerococcus suis TaxID=371602 RepID=A0A1W1Y1W4_9LACT|nr:DUF948 domain-containing protein [Aerococcus suis]MCI7240685.1 DUF948 domain-containing protein [Aerococcus suis]MDD7757913.1 DUF948 domain-containing protein [Aerococcus suis]MDY4646835.1 DUF948 domain-containing protein [Aerococcus suis]SMC30132.1 Uncharacterized protein YoxC, contains an MCP-like domain [Aerococcus suis]
MTGGQIAALIAAVAFAVLVVFIILFLRQVTKTVSEVTDTVKEANETIAILRKDVDGISLEAQGLLNKSNVLLNDVNGKVSQIDPLFKAIGEIGITVSDVNDSTRDLVLNVTNTANAKVDEFKSDDDEKTDEDVARQTGTRVSGVAKVGKSAKALVKKRQIRKANEKSESKAF